MPKTKLPLCAGCGLVIKDGVVMAMNKCWHKDHFQCAHCKKQLKGIKFVQEGNKPYCEQDWAALFGNKNSPICASCNLPVTDTPVTALGQTWHKNHFVCAHCNKPFMGAKFITENGRPYCENDHKLLFGGQQALLTGGQALLTGVQQAPLPGGQQAPWTGGQAPLTSKSWHGETPTTSKSSPDQMQTFHTPVCESCKEPISGTVTFALGKPWHKEHFVCTHCKQPVNNAGFGVMDGQPYCTKDYAALFGKKCSACGQTIQDVLLTALDKPWHRQCFNCNKCKKPITAQQYFIERNGVPICSKCV